MKSQFIIAIIATLTLSMVVADEFSSFEKLYNVEDNGEKCYARIFGYPCCNNNEVKITSYDLGDFDIIDNFVMCGIGYPEGEEMFGDYPYCDECVSNYFDKDGGWYYDKTDKTWCKVNERRCFSICEPKKGYKYCKNSSKIITTDTDGTTWGIEDNHWCLIQTIPEYNDFELTPVSYIDKISGQEYKIVNFLYDKGNNFEEKYEIVTLIINGIPVNFSKITYNSNSFSFKTESVMWKENEIKMILRDKTTKQKYFKIFNNQTIPYNLIHNNTTILDFFSFFHVIKIIIFSENMKL
ncbi:hypothetical protein BCR32DRAFT_272677 [Anaeromyces robustus]|uniref:CBM10 domain-containing protein n=1 Tax=Anaeromyces robustus TaxID=1754192 RepID=A0A1Y1VXI2_9FUNG|nr:hypothetical protein BCR32DRAFT_272677 [Anaeromyces robustus]|eukprot:ORX65990.1 hypothetical protein BCR32DRAFT_272677 [Anaeromyces robustus]